MAIVPLRDVWVTANFQGDPTCSICNPGKPVKVKVDTYGGTQMGGSCYHYRRRDRREVQPAAAGKCDRQLRQGCAAHSGAHRFRRQRKADFNKDGKLRPGMSVTPDVKVR